MRGLGKGSSPTRYHPSAGPTASPVVETGSRGPISEATRATSVPLSMAFVRPATSGERPRFCGQGCGRIAKGPESLVPLAGCEARRQPGKLRPEVLLDTLVGEVDDLGHRDA